MIGETSRSRIRGAIDAATVLAGTCVFAWFIHGRAGHRLVAVAALGLVAFVIARSASDSRTLLKTLGLLDYSRKTVLYSLAGLGFATLLALRYRSLAAASLLPPRLTHVALIAPLIGITEELLFRGFLQGRLSTTNAYAAAVLAAFGHTVYKYLVLMSLPAAGGLDYLSLVIFTFVGGIAFGMLRVLSRSLVPACVAHGAFDILVYGDFQAWPLWVWQ